METAEERVPIKQFCFVCTGNLYRSKYAEACFNYLCIKNNVTNKEHLVVVFVYNQLNIMNTENHLHFQLD